MIGQVSVAAATAVLGYDLFQNQTFRVASKMRRLRGMAVTGSAAAGDTAVDLYIDQFYVGRFYNTDTGFPDLASDLIPLRGNAVPAGATIACIVADAPATNPIQVTLI